jgi:hypothetical protein
LSSRFFSIFKACLLAPPAAARPDEDESEDKGVPVREILSAILEIADGVREVPSSESEVGVEWGWWSLSLSFDTRPMMLLDGKRGREGGKMEMEMIKEASVE